MKSGQTEKLKVVIDTNTIISAPLSENGNPAKIFELLLLEEMSNFTSHEIISEIGEVFDRNKIKSMLSKEKIDFVIKNFKKFSKLIKPNIKLDIIRDDPDDNKILECAETADVEYIISGDKHLKELKNYKKIKIVSPKEFFDIYLKTLDNYPNLSKEDIKAS